MRSHIGWRWERNILYKGVETSLSSRRVLKILMGSSKESPKKIISTNVGLGQLQMVPEPTLGGVPARTLGPEGGGWIVRSHIDWREERVLAKTLGPRKRVDCEISRRLERGTRHSL